MQHAARLVIFLALGLAAEAAAAAGDIAADVRACRAEADAAARLACYDRAVDRVQPAANASPAPKAAPPAAAAAPAAAVAASAEDNFGRERKMEAEAQQRQQQEARALGELQATVTHIDRRIDGLMTITLDNGQVWSQNRPDSKFRLREGDRVKIQPGAMKSFILSGPTNRSTRVSRVQ